MNDGILSSIKKLLGLDEEYKAFDMDVIFGINSALMTLFQIGIGPQEECFHISGYDETWSDLLDGSVNFESVKMYVFLKTRLIFDPPSSSFVLDAMKKEIQELEWRLNVQSDVILKEVIE